MTEEIKEILEEIKEKNKAYEECNENGIIENEYYKSHLLLNYITNLQKELDQYKNNWEELKKCIEENKINISLNPYSKYAITIELVLNKMKELEEDK